MKSKLFGTFLAVGLGMVPASQAFAYDAYTRCETCTPDSIDVYDPATGNTLTQLNQVYQQMTQPPLGESTTIRVCNNMGEHCADFESGMSGWTRVWLMGEG